LLIKQEPEFHYQGKLTHKPLPNLCQQNYFALLSDGKIKPENLQALASGNKPSNPDLAKSAQILEIDEQLKKMRDHEFPINPQGNNAMTSLGIYSRQSAIYAGQTSRLFDTS
jgi:hypothetical protein